MIKVTPRDAEILDLWVTGIGRKEVAYQLNISDKTVDAHLSAIRQCGKFASSEALRAAWARWRMRDESIQVILELAITDVLKNHLDEVVSRLTCRLKELHNAGRSVDFFVLPKPYHPRSSECTPSPGRLRTPLGARAPNMLLPHPCVAEQT